MNTVWQYKFERLTVTDMEGCAELVSRLGDLGWELVAVQADYYQHRGDSFVGRGPNSSNDTIYALDQNLRSLVCVFKREVPATAQDTNKIKQDIEDWKRARQEEQKQMQLSIEKTRAETAEREAQAWAEERRAEAELKKKLKDQAQPAKQHFVPAAEEHGLMWYIGWGAVIGIIIAWLT